MMHQDTTTIRWQPISTARSRLISEGQSFIASKQPKLRRSTSAINAVESMIASVGVPIVEGAKSATEWALALLRLAAEVEHALMVQYLYAAVSVPKETGTDEVSYRTKIMSVAIQEMGHLATVQNLLILVGGVNAVHLQRDELRSTSEKNPIPFVLEPVSLATLAGYVIAESPAEVPDKWKEKVSALHALGKQDAGVPLKRVGVIYEFLRWMFSASIAQEDRRVDFALLLPEMNLPRLSESDLKQPDEIKPFTAEFQEWNTSDAKGFLLFSPYSCVEAVKAIDAIAAQGEGLLDQEESSHFEEFMELVDAYEKGVMPQPSKLATSPSLGNNGGGNSSQISHPYTRLWGGVFSLQYSLTVLSIHHALITSKAQPTGLRGKLIDSAMERMRRLLGRVGDLLSLLPIRKDSADLAGPPYDFDPWLIQSHNPDELPVRHRQLLVDLEGLYKEIVSSPDYAANPAHGTMVANLRRVDNRHQSIFV